MSSGSSPDKPDASARRSRRRARRSESVTRRSSPPSRPIQSALPLLELLSQAQIEEIHEAAMKILALTGVVFRSPEAIKLFAQAGAKLEDERVFLDRDLVETCLSSAPEQYTLHARMPVNSVDLGGRASVVMPGGGPPFVLDLEGARRPGTLADVENFTRLSEMSPEVHVVARKAVEAQDIPAPIRHLECWRSILTLSSKPAQSGMVGGRSEAEDILEMLAIVHGGEEAIEGTPVAHCSVNANSPLLYDAGMLESLLVFARYGQPILISPFVMAGVTGPATLAGALAQHNAEVLAGIALTQLVRPGTPVLFGTASSNVDMRTAAPAIGSPESAISIAVCAQLARLYGLPCRGGGALTDSPIPDAQSSYERMFTLLISVLSGINFLMHGLGILESYLTLSYAQFVLDLDLINMVRHFVRSLEISPETLALETIHEVGPGGFFLDAAHTLRHYENVHFFPMIGLRKPFEQWEAEGAKDATQRAIERCQEMLAEYTQPEMPTQIRDRLIEFTERRKAELLG